MSEPVAIIHQGMEYVHAESVSIALAGHRCSQLFGDTGLLAATMRCVDALGAIEMLIDQSECHNTETVTQILKIIRPNS